MNQYGSNWVIGASVTNHEINKHTQCNRGSYSPYSIMRKCPNKTMIMFLVGLHKRIVIQSMEFWPVTYSGRKQKCLTK
jgi:hypothetical protein